MKDIITRTALHSMQMHAGICLKQGSAKLRRLVCVHNLPKLTSLHHGFQSSSAMQQECWPKIPSFATDRVNRVRRRTSGDDQHRENVADIEVHLVPSSFAVSARLVGVATKLICSWPLHRSTGSSHPPAGNEVQEHSPSSTKWQSNAIMYEYAKESKPVSVRVLTG